MKPPVESRVARAIAASAVALTVIAFVFFGNDVGFATAIGGLLATADFAFMRWAGVRIVGGTMRGQTLVVALLMIKLGALGALLFLLIVPLGVHAGGLALGLSSLFIGIVAGSGVLDRPGRHLHGET
jgi:hypothetical protein